jgi:hypothetical protein
MSGCILLPDGSCYDPALPQDHTGVQFVAQAKNPRRDPRRDPRNFMRNPAWLECPRCKQADRFQLLVEDHPRGDGMMQIYCSRCHDAWPVVQLHQPQMNDRIAKELGVTVPDAAIDFEVELEGE